MPVCFPPTPPHPLTKFHGGNKERIQVNTMYIEFFVTERNTFDLTRELLTSFPHRKISSLLSWSGIKSALSPGGRYLLCRSGMPLGRKRDFSFITLECKQICSLPWSSFANVLAWSCQCPLFRGYAEMADSVGIISQSTTQSSAEKNRSHFKYFE